MVGKSKFLSFVSMCGGGGGEGSKGGWGGIVVDSIFLRGNLYGMKKMKYIFFLKNHCKKKLLFFLLFCHLIFILFWDNKIFYLQKMSFKKKKK